MGTLLAHATRRGTLAQIRHVTPVPPGAARGLVAGVYRQVCRDLGMLAPPIVLHAPAPGVLAASWLMLRETLLAEGSVSRAVKETVAAAVSAGNDCPYCVQVHTVALRGLVRARYAVAIAEGRAVPDPHLRAVAAWARAGGTGPAPVPGGAELMGVAVAFHYLNRMVSVFLDRSPIPPGVPPALRGGVQTVAGWLMAPVVRRSRRPGVALGLLPPAPVPAELAWAAGVPRLADAFGRACAAVDAAGERAIPAPVRELLLERLAGWDGAPPGPDAWGERAVADLGPDERDAGRLALLTAFAAYRVGPSVVGAFRRRHPDDRTLVELTSWASLAAARRLGGRMSAGVATRHRQRE